MSDAPRLPGQVRVLVAGAVAGGLLAIAFRVPEIGRWSEGDVLALALLTVGVVVSEQFQIQVGRGNERDNFAVTDALWTAALMLARPSVLTLAVAAGVIIGQALRRWAPVKVAFNVGQFLLAITAAELIFHNLDAPDPSDPAAWAAAAVAMAAFSLVNSSAMALVMVLLERRPFLDVAFAPAGLLHSAGNIAIGILAALVWDAEPRALPLLLVPLVLAYSAYRAWLESIEERDRMSEIARAAEVICGKGDLSRRIPVEPAGDAVSFVASTFNRMLESLEAAVQRERLFIRAASHELRTPVTICCGHLDVLGPHPSEEELQETVALVVDELDRMTRIIADMTTLAGTEHRDFLRRQSIDLASFMSQVATKAHAFLDGRLRLGPVPSSAVVWADSQRLTQALINLLENAKVHTPEGTQVELRVREEEAAWRFEVADQGDGVPSGQEEAVFRPFVRGGGPGPGSGLGLAITRAIAEAHGGTTGVENRPHEEATFWIRIPRSGSGDEGG